MCVCVLGVGVTSQQWARMDCTTFCLCFRCFPGEAAVLLEEQEEVEGEEVEWEQVEEEDEEGEGEEVGWIRRSRQRRLLGPLRM